MDGIEEVKAFQLAASIREAAEILQTIPDTVRLNLNSLYNSLNVRFGQKYSKEYARLQMKTRLQKTGESLQEYASELERLVNVHRCPTRWVFSGSGLELVTRQATCNTQDISTDDLVNDLLQNTDLEEKQRCATGGLIKEIQSLFSRTSKDFGITRLKKHRIDTGEHPPIKQHPRRLPFAKQEEVQKLIKDMKNNDVIQPSSSPWATLIVLVRKQDGSTRFCVDYHRSQERVLTNRTPPDDRELSSLRDKGLWQFAVMPSLEHLKHSSALWKQSSEDFSSMNPALVYLNGIFIVGRSFEEHFEKIRRVLQKRKRS
ncbi:retrovirus-related Pol polyprotein from transposon 412 [Trichonephila clavipes]|nr:retrovirus-related Pol polyprotein from transposon 412 [Trichonephila clavipes]